MNLQPKICNLCGGEVIFTSNALIYGREYGSGRMYYCTKCKAYVGTHEPRPKEAFGILANEEMRELKKKCHALFDEKWRNKEKSKDRHKARQEAYRKLSETLNIPIEECHFGYFDMDMLKKAYEVLEKENNIEKE